jgi:cell division protein FtsB
MKQLLVVAVVVLLGLQYVLWFGQSGHFAQLRLQAKLDQQQDRMVVLGQRNKILTAQVIALQEDRSVLEARARHDLGLVKTGEVFFLVPDSRF